MLNYSTYLSNGGNDILLKHLELKNHYFCQKCSRPSSALTIYNLTALGNITENNAWICDKCIIEWRRSGVKIDETDEYLVRHEWDVKFLEKMGAGGEKLLSAKRYAVKNIKNRYKDILLQMRFDSNLAAEKEKIENKYANPAIISKKRIKTNSEQSYISNIPQNSFLYIDGETVASPSSIFPNQTATISASSKGKYKIRVVSEYHLDLEDTIDVY